MKNILIALGALLGLLFLAGIAIVSLVDVNAHKPRIEAAVSDALGMEFRIHGKAGLHLFPSASISLSDIRLRNLGTDLATAEAKDVAFATRKNRIAMKGKLDIVNERFVDISVALLDAKGCAKVRQKISGPFRNPKVDKVSTLETAIEPILGLFPQTKQLVARGVCKPFYTGSVAQPR